MSDKTPLQKLDDAIHEFFADTQSPDGRWITGWIIGMSTARIGSSDGDNLPLISGAQYAIGPQTSVTDASGINRFLNVVVDRATENMLDDIEGDDERP